MTESTCLDCGTPSRDPLCKSCLKRRRELLEQAWERILEKV